MPLSAVPAHLDALCERRASGTLFQRFELSCTFHTCTSCRGESGTLTFLQLTHIDTVLSYHVQG